MRSCPTTSRCGHLARLRTLDLPRIEKMASVLEGHKAIISAIEAQDGEMAASAMRPRPANRPGLALQDPSGGDVAWVEM